MRADDLCWMSAAGVAAAIRVGEVSPVEVTAAVLDRIARVNPKINAYVTVAAESALAQARQAEAAVTRGEPLGPLHGVPISFKDLTDTAGLRTTYGSRAFEHHVPKEDAVVVARARRAGAVLIGKTNTPEFGCKGVTDNRVFGATRNPWRLDRIAGGSSGGAAAALAAGLGPLAEGSDLAGSIRVPAACCGVVGLKPSLGRVARYPAKNGWTSFSVVGPMARTVRDAALLLSVLAGPDDRDPISLPDPGSGFAHAAHGAIAGLRLAWTPDLGYAAVEPEIRTVCAAAARRFEALGCTVDEAQPGFDDPEPLFMDLVAPMRAASYGDLLPQWRAEMDPILVQRIERSAGVEAVAFERAQQQRTQLWLTVQRFFERYDVLLTPVTATAPFSIDTQYPTRIAGRDVTSPVAWFPFTFPFAITGQPAISIPCGWTAEGLPVGLHIVGRRHADATVLRVAAAFEAAHPWADRRPAL